MPEPLLMLPSCPGWARRRKTTMCILSIRYRTLFVYLQRCNAIYKKRKAGHVGACRAFVFYLACENSFCMIPRSHAATVMPRLAAASLASAFSFADNRSSKRSPRVFSRRLFMVSYFFVKVLKCAIRYVQMRLVDRVRKTRQKYLCHFQYFNRTR